MPAMLGRVVLNAQRILGLLELLDLQDEDTVILQISGTTYTTKSGQGVTPTPHTLVVPWSRESRAIPLLPLRAL